MTAKRAIDVAVALAVLIVAAPLLAVAMLAIWAEDGGAPLYRGVRVGRGDRDFRMLKLRSMRIDADRLGGTSTARSDVRVTVIGRIVRRWKIDELPQFWNVLIGEMSLVGPRPNMRTGGVDRYTLAELHLLDIRPGITDLASIVFSDEGDILDGAADPDALYDTVIRPWKSRLGLLYVEHRDLATDLRLLWLTALAILAKPMALRGVDAI
ncbi:MAG: sugar transferase, partial [Sphingomonas sp.]|uniref:sugar transferase n=1 Tax=Sphingomonas sp. TaxID=28214 RepID=UPI003F809D4E